MKNRIKIIASGKLITSARAAWALCVGADFVNTARGFMFSLGCIQALRCHQNTCPTGVTTHNKRLQRALVVEEKYLRVANYANNMNREIDMIAHSCGVRHARELKREHVRIVQASGQSVALNMLYPYPELKANHNFLELQNQLAEIEDQIQMARRYYNGAVRNLNITIQSFPDILVARSLGFREEPFFELESRAEAAAPQIGFPGGKA